METSQAHLVLVNVDVVQLMLLRARRAAMLLAMHNYADEATKLEEAAMLLREEIEVNRRRHEGMTTFLRLFALVALMVVVGLAAPSLAQEATPEATAVPVDAVLEPVAGIRAVDIWPLVAVAALVLIGVIETIRSRDFNRLFARYDEALKRKDARDYGEEKFKQSSLQVQDFILLAEGLFRVLGNANIPVLDTAIDATHDYLDAISDGKPNETGENAGPLPEFGARRDITKQPGTTFGQVKPAE